MQEEETQVPTVTLTGEQAAMRHEAMIIRRRLPGFVGKPRAGELVRRCRPRLIRAVNEWQWGSGTLLMLGPTATGKTTAAAYLFRRLLWDATHKGMHSVEWQTMRHAVWTKPQHLNAAKLEHPLGRGEVPEVAAACRAPFLVLDELGWGDDREVVSMVLDARYQRRLSTVATSALRVAELNERYDRAVVRRLFEIGKQSTVVDLYQRGEGE